MWIKYILLALGGYLLGNISMGILVARLYGISDIRKQGSGNAGTTNVLRTLGWAPSVMTMLGDVLKAFIAALIGKWVGGETGMLVAGTFAVIGHDFPALLGFKGGKGIASSWGMILVIDWRIALVLIAALVIIVATTRYMSIASIAGAVLYPILTAIFLRGNVLYGLYIGASLFLAALALFCHRKNIMRLIRKEENRLDFAKISKLKNKIKR